MTSMSVSRPPKDKPLFPGIVWASLAMIAYELYALNTHKCEPWTIHARKRDRSGFIAIVYAVWLLVHLVSGGKI